MQCAVVLVLVSLVFAAAVSLAARPVGTQDTNASLLQRVRENIAKDDLLDQQMRDNLRARIREARAGGAAVLLVGMELPPNYGPDYTGKFREAFAELAREENTAFVPFLLAGFGDKRELFQADTIHPTAAAQPLILDNVWPALAPLLRGSGAGGGKPSKPAAAAPPR